MAICATCAMALTLSPLALPVFVDSAARGAPARYEAENAVCTGLIESNHTGYSGTGFCNGNNAVGAYAEFSVSAGAPVAAVLGVRYANGTTTNRPADVIVNGAIASSGVAFNGTGAWNAWATVTLTVTLNAGINTIRFNPTTPTDCPTWTSLKSSRVAERQAVKWRISTVASFRSGRATATSSAGGCWARNRHQ